MFAVVTSLVAAACTGGPSANGTPSSLRPIRIPQPVVTGVPVAPDSQRVDLFMPTFSNPTRATNPLFPVSRQGSVLFLGHVEGKPFRTEVTLLPFTRIVEWQGRRVETLVSQYLAYLDGRIQEVAYDVYAQADDGSVWYFGEDVADFEDGAIVTKESTWLAGKDAPAAMIMPGHQKVGDVFRTENSPGFAFEEVTVKAVNQTLDGPLSPIKGGLIGQELHMDGQTEDKIFAPGYGEFFTADGRDVEALALAVPTDASSGAPPSSLLILKDGASRVFDAAKTGDSRTASTEVGTMTAAWKSYPTGQIPKLIPPRMNEQLQALARAVGAGDARKAGQLALGVAQSSLDLELRYRSPAAINLARLDLWAARITADAEARDQAAANSDVFTLVYIRDRILGSLTDTGMTRVNSTLQDLQVDATDGNLGAATKAATQLRDILSTVKQTA